MVSLGGATAYAVSDLDRYRDRIADAPPIDKTAEATVAGQPRIVFRHTAIGPYYGLVSTVALADPDGPRAVTDLSCDRIDAVATGGVLPAVRRRGGDALPVAGPGHRPATWWTRTRSPGMPSRTRLSPDGSKVGSTVFVAGHSYMQVGFSTATVVREVGGSSWGNLEKFQLVSTARR